MWARGCSLPQQVTFSENGKVFPDGLSRPQVDVHNRERKARITAPNCDPFAIAINVKHG